MLYMWDHICKPFEFMYRNITYLPLFSAMNIHPNAGGFVIAAGAILGICAGLLWTAQGSLMMAYPTEGQKGKFIGIFWAIFNLGGVVGASVALGLNIHLKVFFYLHKLLVEANKIADQLW